MLYQRVVNKPRLYQRVVNKPRLYQRVGNKPRLYQRVGKKLIPKIKIKLFDFTVSPIC